MLKTEFSQKKALHKKGGGLREISPLHRASRRVHKVLTLPLETHSKNK
jgi:hypothetical protein